MYQNVFSSNMEQETIDKYSYLLEDDKNDKEPMSKKKKAAIIAGVTAAMAASGWTINRLIEGIKANAYANGYAASPRVSITKSAVWSLILTYGLNKVIALARGRAPSEINWMSLFS